MYRDYKYRNGRIFLKDNFLKNNKSNKNTIIMLIIGILYKLLLDYAYLCPLQLNFASEMYKYDLTYMKLIFSYIVVALQFYLLPKKKDSISVFMLILLMYIMVPLGTVYSFKNESSIFYFFTSVLFVFSEIFSAKIKIININNTYKISKYCEYFLYFITFLTYMQLFILKGFPTFEAFNLFNIYAIREQNALIGNKYLYYFVRYQAYAVNPILITINYLNRQKTKLFIIIVLQIFLFLWLGHKYYLFILFVHFIICFLSKYKNKQKIISSLLTFFIFGIILLKSIYINNRYIRMLFSLFIRRAFFDPAILKFNYYEFFCKNDVVGLWGTIIAPLYAAAGFLPPYYPVPFTKIIGEIYVGGSNANTGLWGVEMAHFGLGGLFVAFFSLLIFIYIIKVSENRNGTQFTLIAAFTSVMNLNEGGIIQIFEISPLFFTLIFLSIYTFKYKHKKIHEKKLLM